MLVVKSKDVYFTSKPNKFCLIPVITNLGHRQTRLGIRRLRKHLHIKAEVDGGWNHHSGQLPAANDTNFHHVSTLLVKMLNIRSTLGMHLAMDISNQQGSISVKPLSNTIPRLAPRWCDRDWFPQGDERFSHPF